jgi:TAT (twin-arginine translocation) pathway-exported protein
MAAPDGTDRRGLSRRDMIKASAAAGAAAWTAPVIIDSLSSPAAAATIPPGLCGCHFVVFNNQCNPDNQGTPCNTITGCVQNALVANCLTVTPSVPGNCQSNSSVTISVNPECQPDCLITTADSKSGSVCTSVHPNSFTVTFPPISSPGYAQFDIFLTCSGSGCPPG